MAWTCVYAIAAHRQTLGPSWHGLSVASYLVLFYIYQINRLNSSDDSTIPVNILPFPSLHTVHIWATWQWCFLIIRRYTNHQITLTLCQIFFLLSLFFPWSVLGKPLKPAVIFFLLMSILRQSLYLHEVKPSAVCGVVNQCWRSCRRFGDYHGCCMGWVWRLWSIPMNNPHRLMGIPWGFLNICEIYVEML